MVSEYSLCRRSRKHITLVPWAAAGKWGSAAKVHPKHTTPGRYIALRLELFGKDPHPSPPTRTAVHPCIRESTLSNQHFASVNVVPLRSPTTKKKRNVEIRLGPSLSSIKHWFSDGSQTHVTDSDRVLWETNTCY